MDKIASDYFCHGIPLEAQRDPILLLATTGVLNSMSGQVMLSIQSIEIEPQKTGTHINTLHTKMCAVVTFKHQNKTQTLNAIGSPCQCFNYFVFEFGRILKRRQDALYLVEHTPPAVTDLLSD